MNRKKEYENSNNIYRNRLIGILYNRLFTTTHIPFRKLRQQTVKASKNYVTKDIKVDNFTKLSVAGSPDVTYTQKSGKPTVEVYTSDNIVDLLDIRVKDNTLYVGFKKNVNVSYDKLKVRVSAEKLNGIAVAGSGDVELKTG